MTVKSKLEVSIMNADLNIKGIVKRVKAVMSRQGGYMLPRQVDNFNGELSRYGLIMSQDGVIMPYRYDFCDKDIPDNMCIDVGDMSKKTTSQSVKISPKIIRESGIFNMSLETMSLNQVLKKSMIGKELITGSIRQVFASIPLEERESSFDILTTSAYRFMVGAAEINNVYKYGVPSSQAFNDLDPYAYLVATTTVDDIKERSMYN